MKKSVVTPFRLAVLAVMGAAATAAGAQSMVTARVLSAQPVVEQVPVQDCGPYGGRPSGAGAAVGAVTGGLIGSQLGKGSGHVAGAILGALGGALLGNTAEARQPYHGGCGTRYSQRVTGYDVTYEVGGQQYHTRMAQAPGQWLQVPAPDAYYGQQGYYGQPGYDGAQSYPVQPAPMAAYPVPPAYPAGGESSGVAMAATPPPAYGGYAYPQPAYPQPYPDAYPPQAYPQAYPQSYPQPVYQQPYPQPVYVQPAPRYVSPVGVTLSVGGMVGRHTGVGIGLGF